MDGGDDFRGKGGFDFVVGDGDGCFDIGIGGDDGFEGHAAGGDGVAIVGEFFFEVGNFQGALGDFGVDFGVGDVGGLGDEALGDFLGEEGDFEVGEGFFGEVFVFGGVVGVFGSEAGELFGGYGDGVAPGDGAYEGVEGEGVEVFLAAAFAEFVGWDVALFVGVKECEVVVDGGGDGGIERFAGEDGVSDSGGDTTALVGEALGLGVGFLVGGATAKEGCEQGDEGELFHGEVGVRRRGVRGARVRGGR